MSNPNEYNDLCLTCNYNALCSERKNLIRPVWHCEEFDDYSPKIAQSTAAPKANNPIVSQNVEYDPDFKGLCMNCEKREDCPSARQRAVVWNCNYYL